MASSPAFGARSQSRSPKENIPDRNGSAFPLPCFPSPHIPNRAVFSHADLKAAQLSPPASPVNMALKDYNAANVNSGELAGRDELFSVDGRGTLWPSYHELVAAVHHHLLGGQVWISLLPSAHRRVTVPLR